MSRCPENGGDIDEESCFKILFGRYDLMYPDQHVIPRPNWTRVLKPGTTFGISYLELDPETEPNASEIYDRARIRASRRVSKARSEEDLDEEEPRDANPDMVVGKGPKSPKSTAEDPLVFKDTVGRTSTFSFYEAATLRVSILPKALAQCD